MRPPTELINRVLGKTKFFTLYYGEPVREPWSIQLLDSLETRECRRLDKRIRRGSFPGARPILLLNCNLRLPEDLTAKGLCGFLSELGHPSCSHKACFTTQEMNQVIYQRLTKKLGHHSGFVAEQQKVGVCTYYPINQGDRLVVAHFAV